MNCAWPPKCYGTSADRSRGSAKRRGPDRSCRQTLEIGVDHHRDQLTEVDLRLPAEHLLRLGGVADEVIDLRRA